MLLSHPIRLVIADDHPLIKAGLSYLLTHQKDIEIVGLASNGKEAVEFADQKKPDIIIMDIQMPLLNGIEACAMIKQTNPETKVIAFSAYDDEHVVLQMHAAGARGYFLKDADIQELHKAVQVVHAGGEYYCQSIREKISHLFKFGKFHNHEHEQTQNYSETEHKIIRLICQELTSKEIAELLRLSKRTIEHHKERIQQKMGVRGTVGIAVYALSHLVTSRVSNR